MTHKFKPGDELWFEDHRNRFARGLRVRVKELIGTPLAYTVYPVPYGANFTAFEEELYTDKAKLVGVYGEWCRDPSLCTHKGYCPRDPTCGD